MNKILALIFCVIGFMQFASAAKQCQILYYPSFTPQCSVEHDEEGNLVEECTYVEAIAQVFILTPTDRCEAIASSVGQIDFTGDCDCTYTFYSEDNFHGDVFRDRVETQTTETVLTEYVWSQEARSWKLLCRF